MEINYVLVYGDKYCRLKNEYFESFDDISKFLVIKGIYNYTILVKMNDFIEVEMIHLNNDIKVLEERIDKAIHLINHNDIMHYSVFEKELLEILKGDSDV